jgi:hypothetical protein
MWKQHEPMFIRKLLVPYIVYLIVFIINTEIEFRVDLDDGSRYNTWYEVLARVVLMAFNVYNLYSNIRLLQRHKCS